ncbi:MAG: hypothetical protein ACHQ15_07625 [Candidatus Limnocylindrales bacterium]
MPGPGLALMALGIVLLAVGLVRAQAPYRRAVALREHERNLARYDSWRGGRYVSSEDGPSSAELMQQELLGRARRWGGLALVGLVLVIAGFYLR